MKPVLGVLKKTKIIPCSFLWFPGASGFALVSGTVAVSSGPSSATTVVALTLAFLAVDNKLECVTKHTLVEVVPTIGYDVAWITLHR